MSGRTGAQYGHLARLEHLSHPTSSLRISTQNLSVCTGTRSWTQAHKLGAGSQRFHLTAPVASSPALSPIILIVCNPPRQAKGG
jgi:hypothetical protein